MVECSWGFALTEFPVALQPDMFGLGARNTKVALVWRLQWDIVWSGRVLGRVWHLEERRWERRSKSNWGGGGVSEQVPGKPLFRYRPFQALERTNV